MFAGMKVSLDTKESSYKINLTSIIVDGEILVIENILSKSKSILDKGTYVLSLILEVYNVVVEKILKKTSDAGYEDIRRGLFYVTAG